MSWWNTGNSDDVIGDQPADQVRHGLQRIVEARAQHSKDKPELEELLQAIAFVAETEKGGFSDPLSERKEIVATLKSGGTVSSRIKTPEPSDLVAPLSDSLRLIRELYQDRWERNPKLSEWLRAIEFVLGYRPEDFLSDGIARPTLKIEAK